MVDYEKGTPGWDIGIILTRHTTLAVPICAKVAVLRQTAGRPAAERLAASRAVACSCGAGNSEAENTFKT